MPILGIGTCRYRPICEGKGPRAHVQTLDEGWNVPRGTAPIWKGRGRPREEAGGRGNSMSCGDTVGRFESNPEHLNGFTGPGEAIFAKDETNAHEWSSSSAPRRFKPGSPRPVISLPYTSLAPVKPHFPIPAQGEPPSAPSGSAFTACVRDSRIDKSTSMDVTAEARERRGYVPSFPAARNERAENRVSWKASSSAGRLT